MDRYSLDASVLIHLMNGDSGTRERFHQVSSEARLISTIVLFELWYGVSKSVRSAGNAARLEFVLTSVSVLPLSDADARAAGEVRAALERAKQPIGPYDTLIAGQALARGLTLVTANEREFRRVPGLQVENWAKPSR